MKHHVKIKEYRKFTRGLVSEMGENPSSKKGGGEYPVLKIILSPIKWGLMGGDGEYTPSPP